MLNTYAVAAQRQKSVTKVDDYPTPPWAGRALIESLRNLGMLDDRGTRDCCLEPAAGRGDLAFGLSDWFQYVTCSDAHPYVDTRTGESRERLDFLDPASWDARHGSRRWDWMITNPPFCSAERFSRRGFEVSDNVAILVRLQWLESSSRFQLFSERSPSVVLVFSERVAMVQGRCDPCAGTATCYAWVVFGADATTTSPPRFQISMIPPGTRSRLQRVDDHPGFEFVSSARGGSWRRLS